jgi:hypothetical protein
MEFLSLQIRRRGDEIFIDQAPYTNKVLKRLGMENARSALTPLPEGYLPVKNMADPVSSLRSQYQSVIGSLLYLMIRSRPDICFAVIKMSQHSSNPTEEHLRIARKICCYLVNTSNLGIRFKGNPGDGFQSWTDSDWASDPNNRRSTTGFFTTLTGGAVSWTSTAQRTIACSSTEAEYMALSDCSRSNIWIKSMFAEIGYELGLLPIAGDNMGSIFMSQNAVTEKRSKHIDVKFHFIREAIRNKQVSVSFVEGSENPADLLTKSLGRIKFHKFRSNFGLHEAPSS